MLDVGIMEYQTDGDSIARTRIVAAAMELIKEGGSSAVTTRAVGAAASIQVPTIYRLFGDMDGLLEAVAEKTLVDFVASKSKGMQAVEPVETLRRGMEAYMAFGLANPDVFTLMYKQFGRTSKAASIGYSALCERVRRVALAGRLRVSEERAINICHAMARGTVLAMLDKLPSERKGMAEAASKAALAVVIHDRLPAMDGSAAAAAAALRARLGDLPELSPGEKLLMGELLERIATSSPK